MRTDEEKQLRDAPPVEDADELRPGGAWDADAETISENKNIRQRAWSLFKANYRAFLPVMLVVTLLRLTINALGLLFPEAGFLETVLSILIAPVAVIGLSWVSLRVWDGDAPSARPLVGFVWPGKRLLMGWGIGVTQVILPTLAMVPFLLTAFTGVLGLALLVALIGIVLMVWLSLRLTLLPYALVDAPDDRPGQILKRGWRVSEGNIGRLLGMNIVTTLPYIVIRVLVSAFMRETPQTGIGMLLWDSPEYLLDVFYGGYVQIALAGLARALLGKAPQAE